jgi:hypothetical protein
MKKLFVALLLVIAMSTPALADAKGVCTVNPNPISLSAIDPAIGYGTINVDAVGGVPGELYELAFQQKGHHKTDEARSWLGYADDAGNVFADLAYSDGRVNPLDRDHAMWPGDVSFKFTRYRTGGAPGGAASLLAICTATVVE